MSTAEREPRVRTARADSKPVAEPVQRAAVHEQERERDQGQEQREQLDAAGVDVHREVAEDRGDVAPGQEGADGGSTAPARRDRPAEPVPALP